MAAPIAGEALRVLLVSPWAKMSQEVSVALDSFAGHYQLDQVTQLDQALASARDASPHVVLVDVNLGGPEAMVLIRQLAAQMPRVATVAMVSQAESILAQQAAMAAGARGFVTRPLAESRSFSASCARRWAGALWRPSCRLPPPAPRAQEGWRPTDRSLCGTTR